MLGEVMYAGSEQRTVEWIWGVNFCVTELNQNFLRCVNIIKGFYLQFL